MAQDVEGTVLTDFQTGDRYIRYKSGKTEKIVDEQGVPGMGNWYAPDPSAYSVVPPNQPGPLAGEEPYASVNPIREMVPARPPYNDVFSNPIYPRGLGAGQVTRNPNPVVAPGLGGIESGPADFSTIGGEGGGTANVGSPPLTPGQLNTPPLPAPTFPPGGVSGSAGAPAGGGVPPLSATLQPGSIRHGPPANDEELQQRVKGWAAFGDRLKSDPKLQQALFFLGAQIVQPRYGGQTTLGRLGEAGVGTLNFLNKSAQEENAQEMAKQKLELDKRAQTESEGKTSAQIDQLKTATTKLQTEIKFMPEEHRAEVMKSAAQVESLIREGKFKEAHTKLVEAQAKLEGDPRYIEGKINELNAQAQHYRQAAATVGLTTHERDAQAIARSKINDPNWRPDVRDPALRRATAENEAWQSLEPGGPAAMAARASGEDLAMAADAAYDAAKAGGDKDAAKMTPNQWKMRWLTEQNLMLGLDKKALARAAGIIGGASGGQVGGQMPQGGLKPGANKVKLNQKAGPYEANTIGEYRDGKFYPDVGPDGKPVVQP